MSGWKPLTCKEVKTILKNLDFVHRNTEGSHENWVAENPFRKVTVDCPKAPFSPILIGYMVQQAGVKKKDFYAALHKKRLSGWTAGGSAHTMDEGRDCAPRPRFYVLMRRRQRTVITRTRGAVVAEVLTLIPFLKWSSWDTCTLNPGCNRGSPFVGLTPHLHFSTCTGRRHPW